MSWFFGPKPKYPGQTQHTSTVGPTKRVRWMSLVVICGAESTTFLCFNVGCFVHLICSYTEKHATFVANFETRLEKFIISKKCTVEEFYQMCSKAQEMGDENIEAFIDILSQMLEFRTFVDMCRDKNKRAYVQQILKHYSKILSE